MCQRSASVANVDYSLSLCVWFSLYLSEALPQSGCVCQGDELLLHLINPFFNPVGQNKAHNRSCNWGVNSFKGASQTFHNAIKLSITPSYSYHLKHVAAKQTRPKRITLIGQTKCQPIKPESPRTNTMSSYKRDVTECQPIPLLSKSSNMKSANQISVSQCCDQWQWCEEQHVFFFLGIKELSIICSLLVPSVCISQKSFWAPNFNSEMLHQEMDYYLVAPFFYYRNTICTQHLSYSQKWF